MQQSVQNIDFLSPHQNPMINFGVIYNNFLNRLSFEIKDMKINGLSKAQILIIYFVGNENFLSVVDLTKKTILIGENITYNLKRLSEKKYIEKVKSDKDERIIYVRLTEKGKKAYNSIKEITQKEINNIKIDFNDVLSLINQFKLSYYN
jgi:DNA-binding MarR family transcriptional regulator